MDVEFKFCWLNNASIPTRFLFYFSPSFSYFNDDPKIDPKIDPKKITKKVETGRRKTKLATL